jgi:hypothetical protein
VVADPEDIGSAGRSTLRGPPREHRDCQPYPPWATTTVCFISSLHAYTKGVIVPMTVLARDRATSMLTTLRGCAAVRHLVLHATVQVLKDRIGHDHPPARSRYTARRSVPTGAATWATTTGRPRTGSTAGSHVITN